MCVIKKQKNPKLEFTNKRLTCFNKFTIWHVVYVIKYSVLPKMFSNEICLLFSGYYSKIPLYIPNMNNLAKNDG